jgi:RNA polymerase sigma-70 factor, ECF subfamily
MDFDELAAALPAELPALLRYAHTLTGDGERAEDLVQDTLSRALERSADFRGESYLATWLHRILHNLAVDAHRRAREDPSEDVVEAAEALWRDDGYTVDPTAVVTRAEVRSDLREALSHLPPPLDSPQTSWLAGWLAGLVGWWSWRESNPRPRAQCQVFSGCSL